VCMSRSCVMNENRLSSTVEEGDTSSMQHFTLPIIVEHDRDGYFVTGPTLQGCYSQGETYEEAIANIKDAIRMHIEDRLAGGEEVPEPASVSLSTVEIAV
jgi:predicted RNase H-like HicB family nuclease